MKSKDAVLRTCGSCEWIYSDTPKSKETGCPKCGFASYGARSVYGNRAYKYAKTQKPWFDKKMSDYAVKLYSTINTGK